MLLCQVNNKQDAQITDNHVVCLAEITGMVSIIVSVIGLQEITDTVCPMHQGHLQYTHSGLRSNQILLFQGGGGLDQGVGTVFKRR